MVTREARSWWSMMVSVACSFRRRYRASCRRRALRTGNPPLSVRAVLLRQSNPNLVGDQPSTLPAEGAVDHPEYQPVSRQANVSIVPLREIRPTIGMR